MSAPAREVALVCTSDDRGLAERLRDAAAREIVPTVIARVGDERAARLARAAGAEVGVYAPNAGDGPILLDRGAPTWATAGRTIVAPPGVEIRDAARVVRLVDDPAATSTGDSGGIAIREWDAAVLDGLLERGWRLGPVGRAAAPAATRLDGLRALHLTSVHRPDDGRIFHKEVAALRAAGADATVLGFDPRPARTRRADAGRQLVAEAGRRAVDIVHIHDPELLPAAWLLRRRTGQTVVYDSHEYLGQTTRTKPWIPGPLRTPTAVAVEHIERALVGGVDAVVTVTEDMAVDFADAGVTAVSVANYAPLARFPEPGAPEPGLIVFVGGVSPARGLDLMLDAFAMVDAPGARLLLAGPGSPGPLPPRVSHVGWVDYDDVPALLARATVVWMPQPRTPNWDRARATKVMEAMASGRPVVTSDLRRTAAMVRQAGCGMVVPYDDPGAHAAAITALLRDPQRAHELGAAGRAAFLDHMTFEGEAAKLVTLYAELAGRTA